MDSDTLGLTIMRTLARADLSGTITMSSRPGAGTVAELRISVIAAAQKASVDEAE